MAFSPRQIKDQIVLIYPAKSKASNLIGKAVSLKTPSSRGLTAGSNKYEKMIYYLDPAVKSRDDATIC
ncbi:MAG: palindromic element RPE4 domain-containing protein, partial [Gammaproteobacteria bacterium]|nr:palindromic element RPE4 domain-containing protein [Gammaproteobacteria bacterium]